MKKKRLLTALMATELLLSQFFSGMTVFAGDPDRETAGITGGSSAPYEEGEAIICVKDQKGIFSADIVRSEISAAFGTDSSDLSFETIFDHDPGYGSAVYSAGSSSDDWSLQFVRSASLSTEELISALESKSGVVYAQPNYIYEPDPGWDEEKIYYTADGKTFEDLTSYQFAYGNGEGGIDVPDWNDPDKLNAEGVVVAVLDSGVDHNNPDLAPVMWNEGLSDKYPDLKMFGGNEYGVNTGRIDANGEPGDGVSADTGDNVNGHGTHCAGIIAAAWNGEGVSGAANGCRIMAVKNAVNAQGYSSSLSNILGFYYIYFAALDGVNVAAVNCSWGGISTGMAETKAVEALGEVGVVTCFAAGNDNSNIDIVSDTAGLMSGSFSQICVDSATKDGERSDFSNYGVRNTDVFAPGSDILSTYPVAMSSHLPELEITKPVKDADDVQIIDEFDGEDTYFTYEANSGSSTSVSISGGELRISGTKLSGDDELSGETMGSIGSGRAVAVSVSANKPLPALTEGRDYSIILERKADQQNTYLMVYVKTVSGAWDRPGYSYNMGKRYSSESYLLNGTGLYTGESFDLENLNIRFVIYNSNSDVKELSGICINKLWITSDDTIPFEYASGTSMATPATVGAVAIVAAGFPEDSAYKRAARILASVRKDSDYEGICETGGLVNVRNALDESTYTPVLKDVGYTSEGKIRLSGYFFGDKENTALSIRQGEKSWSTADGRLSIVSVNKASADADELIIEKPEGISRGELIVTITDSAKAEDRQSYTKYMEIGDPVPGVSSNEMFDRIAVPKEVEDQLDGFLPETMTAVNGKFVAAGYDVRDYYYQTLIFDGEKWDIYTGEKSLGYSGRIESWGGKVLASDGIALNIYDTQTNSSQSVYLTAPYNNEELDGCLDSLYYDGKNLLLLRTEVLYYEEIENYIYGPTEVWLIKDPYSGMMEQLGTMDYSYRGVPVIAHHEKADGKTEYYVAGVQGIVEGAFGMECFTIEPEFSCRPLMGVLPANVQVMADELNPVAGAGVKNGILLTGIFTLKDPEAKIANITADAFFMSFDDIDAGFKPLEKRLAGARIYMPVAEAYDGKVVIYALDTPAGSTQSLAALYCIDMETNPEYGDKAVEQKTDTSVKVKKIKMTGKKTVSVGYAEKISCEVTFADPSKTAITVFESSNDEVLKVNSITGEMLGVRPGTATVTASCGNKKAKCVVTVTLGNQKDMVGPVREYSEGDIIELKVGEVDYWQLKNVYVTGKEKLSWKTSNKKVVTVNKGIFTAKGSGKADITAVWSNGSEKKEIRFTVSVNGVDIPKSQKADKSVKLSVEKSALKLQAGDTKSFSADLKGNLPEDYVVKFSTTNDKLLLVGDHEDSVELKPEGGKAAVSLNALGAGTVYLVVESYSKAAPEKMNRKLCKLVISAPAEEIILLGDSAELMYQETIYMKKGTCTSLEFTLAPEVCTDAAKLKFKAKGGTVSVKNGVITARKVKKNKSGDYVPSTVTISAGKQKKEITVYVVD
ncbi:MAG: S8 family serine peptidase [Lachnospiraceae bacterium]|nr:S8 family serine peptidase [Lachnospiraceae bacterium]